MTAKLVWATPGGDDLIAFMARVSNPKNQDNKETAPKLIKYLIKHKHWSPLEMVSMCLEIETTRDISAQIIRHRSFSFQEFSQRYARVAPPEFFEFRMQDQKNRQNSVESTLDPALESALQDEVATAYARAYLAYDKMIDAGVAKECARKVLPMNSPTKLYMAGTLRSWYHYCALRCGNGTQKEHKLIAEQARDIFRSQFPATAAACFDRLG